MSRGILSGRVVPRLPFVHAAQRVVMLAACMLLSSAFYRDNHPFANTPFHSPNARSAQGGAAGGGTGVQAAPRSGTGGGAAAASTRAADCRPQPPRPPLSNFLAPGYSSLKASPTELGYGPKYSCSELS